MDQRHRNGFTVSRRSETSPATLHRVSPPPAVMDPIPPILRETLPPHITEAVLIACRKDGDQGLLEEIRLRASRQASLTLAGRNLMLDLTMTSTELFSILTRMCGGSLYAYSQNINEGFVTLPGGIRVGVAGEASCEEGRVVGVREISALCIRIPHSHGIVGGEIADLLRQMVRSKGTPEGILMYAPPGVGKTTLLRGVAAHLASGRDPWRTVVVDTRGELTFPLGGASLCLDVLTGYPRGLGVNIATRSLGAQVIICDEIGDSREAFALISAYLGGVPLIATAHGSSVRELLGRAGIRTLHKAGLFGAYVGLRRDGYGGFLYDVTRGEDVGYAI